MSDYLDYAEIASGLAAERERASALWAIVYECLGQALADIEAGHPTLEQMEDGTATPAGEVDAEEVRILREAAYEIVQAALIALGT